MWGTLFAFVDLLRSGCFTGSMDVPVFAFLVLALGLGVFVWWLVVLIEALKTPETQWKDAGQDRLLWVLLMVFLGVIGTLSYVIVARPRLRRATAPTSTT